MPFIRVRVPPCSYCKGRLKRIREGFYACQECGRKFRAFSKVILEEVKEERRRI